MDFFSDLLNALPGALAQGLIWGLMAIGVYITFKVLDLADLTVDGTMCTGGAVCIMLMTNGVNVWVALLCAFIAGMIAGGVTDLLWYNLDGGIFDIYEIIPGFVVSAAVIVIVSLCSKLPQEIAEEFDSVKTTQF